jgi:hypothetical protein
MRVNPWYIPGTLQNVSSNGTPTGFEFTYRQAKFRLLYVTHKMTLFVDGVAIKQPNLRLTRNGLTVSATDLVTTTWACEPGEPIQFAADLPGGLSKGTHTIRIDAVFGGKGDGSNGSKPIQIIDFQAEVK